MYKPLITSTRLWNTCGQLCVQACEVYWFISTQSTAVSLSKFYMQVYTQFRTQCTALLSTIKNYTYTTVILISLHSIHRAYNYNYLYIKKGH